MKIITVSMSEEYVSKIDELLSDEELYPSRSELFRVAIRDFLMKELDMLKFLMEDDEKTECEETEQNAEMFDDTECVKVPDQESGYKVYKLIKK